MQKDSKSRYVTILHKSDLIEDNLTKFSNTSFESNNFGLYGLVGIVPKYSKPFSQAYLQKLQNDYQSWIESSHDEEYHEMMKEAEIKEKGLQSTKDPTKTKITSNLSSLQSNQRIENKFDLCKVRRILSKSFKHKESNITNNPTENNKSIDPKITNKNHEVKLSKKILKYDELDLQNKKEKARLLHFEMTKFLNNKRNEKLQLGLACHQEWAIMRATAPTKQTENEIQRPITATSKEAMDELEQFEQKQKLIRKEMKAAKILK